eukprot:9015801-Alexandrium_andersonii.AAC.1
MPTDHLEPASLCSLHLPQAGTRRSRCLPRGMRMRIQVLHRRAITTAILAICECWGAPAALKQ